MGPYDMGSWAFSLSLHHLNNISVFCSKDPQGLRGPMDPFEFWAKGPKRALKGFCCARELRRKGPKGPRQSKHINCLLTLSSLWRYDVRAHRPVCVDSDIVVSRLTMNSGVRQ